MLRKIFFVVFLLVASTSLANAGTGQGKGSCIYCHTGGVPTGENISGCGGCHINPPKTGAHLTHTDGSGAIYGNDSNASSDAYRFNCGNCHPMAAAKHGDNAVEVELYNPLTAGFKKNNPATAGRTGTGGATVCDTIYCHSAGQIATTNTYTPTPTWNGSFSGNRCAACHGYPPSYPNKAPKANSHVPHGYSCDTCHAGTTDGSIITNRTLHVNGAFNVAPGAGVSFGYSYAADGGTCSNISCHGNTDATWGGEAACNVCHGYPPPKGAGNYGSDENGSPHMKHAGKGTNYSYNCDECHKGNRHATGTFQDVFLESGILAGSGASYNTATRTCATVYCHSSGAPIGSANDYKEVSWSAKLPADCTGCHGGNASSVRPIATGRHGAHTGATGGNYRCGICHGSTVGGNDRVITGLSSHVDGKKTVTLSSGVYDQPTRSCVATECHQSGKVAAPQPAAPTWSGAALGCNGCHGTGNALGAPDYPNGGAAAALANSHAKHAKSASDCDKCHTGTTTSGTFINAGSLLHLNKNIDVTFNSAKSGASATWNPGSKTCSGTQCHGSGQPVWGGTMVGGCAGCHGNDAASVSPIATGKHKPHMNNYSTLGAGNNYACVTCHANTLSDNQTLIDGPNHGNGFKNYSGVKAGRVAVSGSGECSNNYCHSTGAKNNQFWNMTSANWSSTRTVSCNGCHGGSHLPDGTAVAFASVAGEPNYASGNPGADSANSHEKHVSGRGVSDSTGCAACHKRTADASVPARLRSYSSAHINKVRDVDFSAPPSVLSTSAVQSRYSSTSKQCLNTYCHSDGTAVANGVIGSQGATFGNRTTAAWGTKGATTCTSCHDYRPSYGQAYWVKMEAPWPSWAGPKANAHFVGWHGDEPCYSCHYDTTTDGTTITGPSKHANGVYDVVPGPDVAFRYEYDPAGGTCSSISCHGWNSHPQPIAWGEGAYLMHADWPKKTACRTYAFSADESELMARNNYHWPDIPPLTVNWDFGDGASAAGSFKVSHTYAQPGNYQVKLTVRDKTQHLSYNNISLPVDNNNMKPVTKVVPAVDNANLTVTLTDQSYDGDYNGCGHSGSGIVIINWNDGTVPETHTLELTDTPSNAVFQHVYQNPGTYNITYQVKDNSGDWSEAQYPPFTVQVGTTAPLSTFKGHVTDYVTGLGLAGVTVQLKNPLVVPSVVGTTSTDASGYYEFTGFPLNVTYSVEVSKDDYLFNPAAKSAWLSSASAGGSVTNDFHSSAADTEPKINISGRITDESGAGLLSYVSLMKGDVVVYSTATERTSGTYSFGDVDDDCYTVKPAYEVTYGYTPATREVCFSNNQVDFTYHPVPVIAQITGSVQDAAGSAIANVALSIKDESGKVVAQTGTGTSPTGVFSIGNRPAAGCYTLEPQKFGYTFTPASRSICAAGGESVSSLTFIGQPTAPLITIGGQITADNNGLLYYPYIYLKKDGTVISKSSTGWNGTVPFLFDAVPKDCYTVEPADERYLFTPASQEVCDSSSTVAFSSAPRETMNLNGELYNENGIPVRYPVTVNVKDAGGAVLASVASYVSPDSYLGKYMATVRKGCLTVEPQPGPFTFTPPTQSICETTTNVNFKAADTRIRVKGRVTDQTGTGVENQILYLEDAGGNVIRNQTTVSGGYFSFGKLPAGCYQVVPAAGSYPFSPLGKSVCAADGNVNFTAITIGSGTVASTLDSTSVNLTWLDNSSDESGFTVERCSGSGCSDFAPIATVSADLTQYTDTTACSATSYRYRTRAFKSGAWEVLSNSADAATNAPAAPSAFSATVQSDVRTMLSWSFAGSDLSTFTLERCSGTGCSDFAPIASVSGSARTYFDSGLTPGSYSYRMRAHKDASCPWDSDYSETASANTATAAVTGFTLAADSSTSALASWGDNSVLGTGYKLERCSGDGCVNFSEIASYDKDPAALMILNMDEPAWSGIPGEVMDSSGNNRHGTAANGASTVEGKFGRAGSFDGIGGFVSAAVDGRSLYQWSVELWLKPQGPNVQTIPFQWGDSSAIATSNPFLRLVRRSDGMVEWDYSYYLGGTRPYSGTSYTGITAVADGQWTHLVITYDGTYLRSYANGALIASPQQITLLQNDKAQVALFGAGKGWSGTATYFRGAIDGAAMYRRALSAADVLSRFQSGSDTAVCSATTYRYRVKAVNKGLSNAGGGCWSARAPLAVANFQSNFQTRVVVPFASGMKSTFDDVRFYDAAAAKELPFWLDTKTDGVSATFWVRTGDSSNIYLYYGNGSATSSSSGKSTFELFDDFSNTITTYSGWNPTFWYYSGYRNDVLASGGTANFNYWAGDSDSIQAGINLSGDFQAQVKLNSYTVNDKTLAGIAAYDTSTAYTFGRYRNDASSVNGFRTQKLDGTHVADLADTTVPAYLALRKVGTSYSFLMSHDNASWSAVGSSFNDITPTMILLGNGLTTSTSNSNFSMDNFFLRRYAANEPAGAPGAAEQLSACVTLAWDNPYSDPVTVTTATPAAPSALTLKGYDTEIDLNWTRNTSDETGFKIERCQGAGCGNFAQIATVGTNVTSYADTGLTLGASYSYRVKAYKTASCGWETGYSESAGVTTRVIAPEITGSAANTTQVNLSWLDNTRSETGFTVERCDGEGCGQFTPIATVTGTAFTDSSVCTGGSYTYRVSALSAGFTNSNGGCWQYRVPLTISNFQPNYQMRVALYANANIRSDFGDVRFYDAATGKELPYWFEGGYNPAAWVRTGDSSNIYMYFGNPSATSASNGRAVFEAFDDFSGTTIDNNLWTVLPGNGTIGEGGGALNFSYTGSGANDWSAANGRQGAVLRLNSLPAGDFMAMTKINSYTVNTSSHAGIGVYGSDTSAYLWGRYSGPPEDYGLTKLDGTLIGAYTSSILPELFGIKKQGTGYSFYYGTDNYYIQQKGNIYNDVPFNGVVLFGKEWGNNSLAFGLDYFLVRKVAAKEPIVNYSMTPLTQATVCGANWSGPISSTVSVTTQPPAPPTALSASAVTPSRINLGWSQSSDESGFKVERCSGDGCSDFSEIGTVAADVTTYSDSAVVSGTSYSYRLRGYKTSAGCNWVSDYSNPASATALLAPPPGLSASVVSDTQINLSWGDTSDAENGYRIERCSGARCTDFAVIGSVAAHVTSYPDTTVVSGNSYSYRVRAWAGGLFDSGGGCWSKKAQVTMSSGFQPNYQTRMTIYSSPTSTPGLKPDFSDIRFYDETAKQELPYWIEKLVPGSLNSVTATVWFKTGANNNISMYFGNQNATSASSGKKTFEFFDDFADGSLDSAWTQLAGSGTVSEGVGALNFSYDGSTGNDWNASGRQGAALLMSSLPAGDFFAQVRLNDYTLTDQSFAGIGVYGSDTSAYLFGRYLTSSYANFGLKKNDGTVMATVNSTITPHYLGIKKMGGQYTFYETSDTTSWIVAGGNYSDIPFNGITLFGKEAGTSALSFSMGQFLIRKAVAVEPSYVSVRPDYPTSVFLCTEPWEGPYSNEAYVTTSGGHQNHMPVISSVAPTSATEGAPYSYQVAATDEDGDALTYRLVGNPAGMTISGDGLISWTPDFFQAQKASPIVTVAVDDGWGAPATQTFAIVVGDTPRAPVLAAIAPQAATANVPFSYRVSASDPDLKSLGYIIAATPAADGLAIDSTGKISWLPPNAAAGNYSVTVTANDGLMSASQQFTLTVAANNAPTIDSAAPDHASANALLSYQVGASDLDGDVLSYALTVWPAGMTITPSGLITWTPASAQAGLSAPVAVKVTDSQGASVLHKFSLSVPAITSTAATVAAAGIPYSYRITPLDPAGASFTSYTLTGNPGWMNIDSTGLISGTPGAGDGGSSTVTVRAYVGAAYAVQDFTMSVVSAPTGVTGAPGSASAVISWTPGTGAASSLVRYGTTSGSYTTTVDPATSPLSLSSLSNGVNYYFQVGAKNAAGIVWSAENSFKPVAPPSAPTGISSSPGNAQATINWTAGTNSTSSLITYGTSSGVYTTTLDPATAPQVVAGLTNGQTIYYKVGAKNAGGTTWSSQYNVTPVAPPSAPTSVTATTPASGQVTFSWTAGIGGTSSTLRYGTSSGTYGTTLSAVTSPRTVSGLANGTMLYYQVGAVNAGGTTWSAEYTVTPLAPPSAPTGISATAASGQVTVNWTAGTGATSSTIKWGTTSGSFPNLIDPAVSPRTITGLTNGQTIYYEVGSKNSVSIVYSTQYTVIPLAAPTGISATAGSGQMTVSWSAGVGATSSLIRYGTASGNYTTTIDPATSPKTVTGLASGTKIYYQVGGKNSYGTQWSAEYNTTP